MSLDNVQWREITDEFTFMKRSESASLNGWKLTTKH